MKISLDWLSDHIDTGLTPEELSERLLMIGFEVDSIEHRGPQFSGVVVGEVLKKDKHPNADKLALCEVSDGESTYPVVCGAPNVAAGQKIALARVGARLPGGIKIKKSKIRGQVSQGMICSASELGISGADDGGIHVLPADSVLGKDFREIVSGKADTILDVNITPNRPDCLSHRGLARELAVHLGVSLKPRSDNAPEQSSETSFPVQILEPKECERYVGRIIEGVTIGPSPDWLATRLEAIGLKPINNVVDITNFILHDTGQPLHAFDADTLEGRRLEVRFAKPGEKITALDEKEYSLAEANLVIADAKRPVAIAGVIGGADTGVTEKTARIFLECAHFRPGRVRKSGRPLGILTDSSYRFERGVDFDAIDEISKRAATLILELAGGALGPASDSNPRQAAHAVITTTAAQINEILGTQHPNDRVEAVLERLSEDFGREGDTLRISPPSYRLDLETRWDLAEEIARHLGYDSVPSEAATVGLSGAQDPKQEVENDRLRVALLGHGFSEAYNYDFLSEDEVRRFSPDAPEPPRLANPISEDWAFLRPSLLPALIRSASLNLKRGRTGVRFFEFGRVYAAKNGGVEETPRLAGVIVGAFPTDAHWTGSGNRPDVFALKGVLENVFEDYPVRWNSAKGKDGIFHPGRTLELIAGPGPVGRAGLLHPALLADWDLEGKEVAAFELDLGPLLRVKRGPRRYAPYSALPSSKRDLSLLVDSGIPFGDLESAVSKLKISELSRLDLVDLFSGEGIPDGKKSWTLRLSFSSSERTLRDAEVQSAVDKILEAARAACGAELRG